MTPRSNARSLFVVWSALLVSAAACGESKSDGTGERDDDRGPPGECPDGYPYCPTLDACLLPGRTCPEPEENGGSAGMPAEALPEPPLEPTPGQIRCGASVCDSQTEYCCSGAGGNGNLGGFVSCSDTFCPYRRECDETSDCVGTEICCYSVVASPPPVLAGLCRQPAECGSDGWIACGSQADCAAVGAPPCMDQPCGEDTLQTCGPITRSACK